MKFPTLYTVWVVRKNQPHFIYAASSFEAATDYFAEARARRSKLAADPEQVEDILAAGAKTARAKGQAVLQRVREACGLGHQKY